MGDDLGVRGVTVSAAFNTARAENVLTEGDVTCRVTDNGFVDNRFGSKASPTGLLGVGDGVLHGAGDAAL